MSCMKCGKEVSAGQVFCDECLLEMEKYPVKPGTPVLLPNRPTAPVVHKRRFYKRQRKPEEQLSTYKNWITFFCIFCCVLVVALTLSIMLNLHLLGNKDINFLPGQNYKPDQTVDSTPSSTAGSTAADPTGTTAASSSDPAGGTQP